jgi:alkanesulfonate monooxygenase SsuD/methylene tetrahydromethanopterin reductase-like flavin-dependent oxidoreductase (luciferase family)
MTTTRDSVLQFGVYLPNVAWVTPPPPEELATYAIEAEQGGFDSVWVEDRLLHSEIEMLEAITTLTFVAARTSKISLGIIGASLGGRVFEYAAAGVSMRTRVTRFNNAIQFLRTAWGEEQPSRPDLLTVPMLPRPVQSHIPMWLGGRVEAALGRAGIIGDGWLASSTTTPEAFRKGWETVSAHAAAAGPCTADASEVLLYPCRRLYRASIIAARNNPTEVLRRAIRRSEPRDIRATRALHRTGDKISRCRSSHAHLRYGHARSSAARASSAGNSACATGPWSPTQIGLPCSPVSQRGLFVCELLYVEAYRLFPCRSMERIDRQG